VRVTKTIATGVLLGWMCQSSLAVQPPCIDRPTPPPCCADGQCFASPLTYGYYDTRWRRWPLEVMAQAQAAPTTPGAAPAAVQNEVPRFVRPPAEQEDRKAPPPSVPAGEQPGAAGRTQGPPAGPGGPAGPQGPQTPGGPAGPATQPHPGTGFTPPPFPGSGLPATPPTSPIQPGGQGTQPSTQPLYKNVPPESPLNRNVTPMGDADPPPALPFGPALVVPQQQQPTRDVSQQPAAMPVQRPAVRPTESPSNNDPPPAPPIALVSYEQEQ
jgi:hypothetical protein